jgi:hypothetical protein
MQLYFVNRTIFKFLSDIFYFLFCGSYAVAIVEKRLTRFVASVTKTIYLNLPAPTLITTS